MKKEQIISDIKTAGVVLTTALVMNSCDKPLTPQQSEIVTHKADSAARENVDFRIAQNILEITSGKVFNYHNANVNLVKKYSRRYINRNIKDAKLHRIMIAGIEQESLSFSSTYGSEEYDENVNENDTTLINTKYIRQNQRWYHDLMMYLTGNYTDKQLLKSEFFKVISDKGLKSEFERNLKQIEALEKDMDFAYDSSAKVYKDIWNHYAEEVKHSKQR